VSHTAGVAGCDMTVDFSKVYDFDTRQHASALFLARLFCSTAPRMAPLAVLRRDTAGPRVKHR